MRILTRWAVVAIASAGLIAGCGSNTKVETVSSVPRDSDPDLQRPHRETHHASGTATEGPVRPSDEELRRRRQFVQRP